MRIDDIARYTKKELLEIARNELGIEDKVLDTLNTKKEIAELINEVAHFLPKEEKSEDSNKKKKRKKTAAELKRELLSLKRVIITPLREIEQFENENENRVVFITWGNTVLGHHTNRVIFNKEWMLPEGCVRNLENVEYRPVSNKGPKPVVGAPRKAYKVERLPLPTEEELRRIAERQKLREAQGIQ